MAEEHRQALINKLIDSGENLRVLQSILEREQWNTEQELKIITGTRQKLKEALYELTGNAFYKEEETGEGQK